MKTFKQFLSEEQKLVVQPNEVFYKIIGWHSINLKNIINQMHKFLKNIKQKNKNLIKLVRNKKFNCNQTRY